MKTLTASAAKENLGTLLEMVQSEPVRLQEQGRDVAIVLSPSEFQRLSTGADHQSPSAVFGLPEAERSALMAQAREASRALKDDPRERKVLDELESLQAENADALRP